MPNHETSSKIKAGVLRVEGVCALIACSPATVWRFVKTRPDFPKPFKLSPATTVWDEAEVIAWLESKKSQRAA